ncbi:uncharacterized protein [Nicotiana tomentosiformis]|uniref:uncharacterized protein n=1 Tax=Nicotiana tomentosiformis TaxID=4098 RepID=UPI00388CDF9F
MVEKGCLAYLAYVRDTAETPTIDSVPVVREFSDVFPSDLLSMPPDHNIDFSIDLAPGTQPIFIPLYRMAPKELKELKEQLEELLARGVVMLNVSPWGAPVLFVKKKDGRPLTRLNQKGAPFRWSNDCEAIFQKLKTTLTTAQVLLLPSDSEMYTMYCDTSRIGLGCVVMQERRVIAYVSQPSRVLSCVVAQFSLFERIKDRQYDDLHLLVLRETLLLGGVKEVTISDDGVLRLQGRVCVPNVDGLREKILEEAHSSRYSIHPGATKMYHDMRLTKSAHYIPVVTMYSSERLAQIYIQEIVHLHGVIISTISDRGPQITLHLWRVVQRQWDRFLPLAEFAYNNSYQSSIEIALFEALYGRRCHSPIRWFEPSEAKLYGSDLVKDPLEKVKFIQERLCTAQSRQKSYADRKIDIARRVGML